MTRIFVLLLIFLNTYVVATGQMMAKAEPSFEQLLEDAKPKGKVRKTSIFDINKPKKNFNLKLNAFEAAFNTFALLPELKLWSKNTITLGLGFGSRNNNGVKGDFWYFAPEYRRYIFKDARGDFHGGYVGLYAKLRNEQTDLNSRYLQFGPGFVVGRQWIVKDLITLDTFIGAGYYLFNQNRKGLNANESLPGNGDIRIGLAIGLCPE